MAELVVLRDEVELDRRPLVGDVTTIGRQDDNDIVISNAKISRHHARVVRRGDSFIIEDCGSANGLLYRGRAIRDRELCDHDRIEIGDHFLVFVAEDGAGGSSRPRPNTFATGADWLQSMLASPRANERLQALFEISKALEEATDFKAVLVQLLDKAIAIMGGERGFLMLRNDDGELQVSVARDHQGDITGVEREKVSRGLMQRVIEMRSPLVTTDAANEEWATQSIVAHGIHAAICAPLLTRDVVTGVIYVDHRVRANVFTDEDLAFFTTFSVQAKSAIDASRTYWELVESLFKASDDFIAVCTTERRISRANRTAHELVGLSAADVTMRCLEDLVVEADRERVVEMCREVVAQGVISGHEVRLSTAAGEVPMSVSGFALRDQVGGVIGLCVIARDLSEIKGLIGKLTEVNRTLEVRNAFIKKTFGRYLSDEVVESLLESPEGLELGGAKRRVTILMSDLRGFTSLAERLPAEQVVTVLNHYLGMMVDIITRHQGTIDELIGDAILVIFGAPETRGDDALRAAACAVAMQLEMAAVNRWNVDQGLPELEMGIALNTGDVVVGNIGSYKRSKYAVVGRQVNLTARVESNTVGGQVLVTEGTREAAGETLIIGRSMDLLVKGVKGALRAYELLGVGAPFDLMLPVARHELSTLAEAVPVRFTLLEGKQAGGPQYDGHITRFGEHLAELRAEVEPEPLTDLKLLFEVAPGQWEEAYAKVVEARVAPLVTRVHFTSIPPEIAAVLNAALG